VNVFARFQTALCDLLMAARICEIKNQFDCWICRQLREIRIGARWPALAKRCKIRRVTIVSANEFKIRVTAKGLPVKIGHVPASDDGDVHRSFRERLHCQAQNNLFPPSLQLPRSLPCLFRCREKSLAQYR